MQALYRTVQANKADQKHIIQIQQQPFQHLI